MRVKDIREGGIGEEMLRELKACESIRALFKDLPRYLEAVIVNLLPLLPAEIDSPNSRLNALVISSIRG